MRKKLRDRNNATDISLLVDPTTRDEIMPWDKHLIALALEKEADVPAVVAAEIASAVERRILNSGLRRISTALVRELVDNELFERGLAATLARQTSIGMPIFDLEQVIFAKSNENSNITANNPEAINLTIAENTLKQYALKKVFAFADAVNGPARAFWEKRGFEEAAVLHEFHHDCDGVLYVLDVP